MFQCMGTLAWRFEGDFRAHFLAVGWFLLALCLHCSMCPALSGLEPTRSSKAWDSESEREQSGRQFRLSSEAHIVRDPVHFMVSYKSSFNQRANAEQTDSHDSKQHESGTSDIKRQGLSLGLKGISPKSPCCQSPSAIPGFMLYGMLCQHYPCLFCIVFRSYLDSYVSARLGCRAL